MGRGLWVVAATAVALAACTSSRISTGADSQVTTTTASPATTVAVSTTVPATSTTFTAPAPVGTHVPEPTGERLVIAGYHSNTASFAQLDVDRATLTVVPLPAGLDPIFDNFQLVPTTGGLVVLGSVDTGAGHAAMPVLRYPQLSSAPITIGHATVIYPAARADRLWLTSDLATGIGPASVHLTEIDLNGAPVTTLTVQAPAGAVIGKVEPVTDGFVAATGGATQELVVHYPASGTPTTVAVGRLIAAAGTTLVWSSTGTSTTGSLHVTDLDTHVTHTYANSQELTFPSVVSPDGAHLLAHIAATGSEASGPAELIDFGTSVTTPGPQISADNAVWDAASANVYFVEADELHIDAWHAADGTIVRLPATGPWVTAIAIR